MNLILFFPSTTKINQQWIYGNYVRTDNVRNINLYYIHRNPLLCIYNIYYTCPYGRRVNRHTHSPLPADVWTERTPSSRTQPVFWVSSWQAWQTTAEALLRRWRGWPLSCPPAAWSCARGRSSRLVWGWSWGRAGRRSAGLVARGSRRDAGTADTPLCWESHLKYHISHTS